MVLSTPFPAAQVLSEVLGRSISGGFSHSCLDRLVFSPGNRLGEAREARVSYPIIRWLRSMSPGHEHTYQSGLVAAQMLALMRLRLV